MMSRNMDDFFAFNLQEKVIYHQTMTPTWLEAHASYIDSSHTTTTEQLTFNAGSATFAALLKVPMIPAGVLQYSASVTAKIMTPVSGHQRTVMFLMVCQTGQVLSGLLGEIGLIIAAAAHVLGSRAPLVHI